MQDELSLKEKLAYTLIGVTVIGGSFFIGKNLIRKAKASGEEKKTFEEGSPATYAKQIKMAFENDAPFGWGTDEEALRKIFTSIQSKEEFKKVISSYSKLYARSMMADMKEELSSSEYSEMLSIIGSKPGTVITTAYRIGSSQYEAWARRLKAAFDISYLFMPGTDEDAIKTVFLEMPTQAAFWETGSYYKKLYGNDLMHDLKSELEFWEYSNYMSLIENKPKA